MKNPLVKYHLPKKVKVVLHKAKEGGFVVEFAQLPGCFTQIEDLSQLHESVTDAILTYFDVPREEASKMVYIPETHETAQAAIKRPHINPAQTKFDLFVAA
ncbi:hypothetical protein A3I48_03860 [Candidatus Daviesbacteria bacterium RIFCSPLOWO2_02_FULL_36_7]|uniref:HicB-like antitoxin of toxin-antitoxin system domain-containing protein n=1 Tax=Candidatus Daviesbacteria bacterium RIFCSPLOWO2_02_FULL_36_7 TaxID=1797792 RepID=A0A1F5MHJ5_9BACT|nr:MAG: hypothetical protein A3I48_03860 [Candidatus Daviesbacteria bacterium RIFCSPLOWO2_02_FULL_36_7]